jgi:hypothetical protein
MAAAHTECSRRRRGRASGSYSAGARRSCLSVCGPTLRVTSTPKIVSDGAAGSRFHLSRWTLTVRVGVRVRGWGPERVPVSSESRQRVEARCGEGCGPTLVEIALTAYSHDERLTHSTI